MVATQTYNLALADLYLEKLLEALRSTVSADQTLVVLCSDHSWRIPLWKGAARWTKKDEEASRAGFDSRPVLLLHFPLQQKPTLITQGINSLLVHDLFQTILHGDINDETDAGELLQKRD